MPAQNPRNRIGAVLGSNYHYFKPENSFNHEYKTNASFVYSFEWIYFLTKRISFCPRLSLSTLIYSADYHFAAVQLPDPLIPMHTEVNTTYSEIPVFLGFSIFPFNSTRKFNMTIKGGPSWLFPGTEDEKTTFQTNTTRNAGYLNSTVTAVNADLVFHFRDGQHAEWKVCAGYAYMLNGIDRIMDENPSRISLTAGLNFDVRWKCFFKRGAWKPFPVSCD
jgi:hypothetical protein